MSSCFSRSDIITMAAFSRICHQTGIPRDMEVEILEYLIYMIESRKYKFILTATHNGKRDVIKRFKTLPKVGEGTGYCLDYIKSKFKCTIENSSNFNGYILTRKHEDIGGNRKEDFVTMIFMDEDKRKFVKGPVEFNIPEPIKFRFCYIKN